MRDEKYQVTPATESVTVAIFISKKRPSGIVTHVRKHWKG